MLICFRFCADVIEGRKHLSAGDYMNFMYAETVEYDEDKVEEGLLRNTFLLAVSNSICHLSESAHF